VHAPGHAAGLCCFETESGDEAFVGDALLPVYTPNVGGADVRVERPLERYVATLDRLIDRDYERVWPGHRDPIAEPTARADAILEHHRERTDTILAFLDDHGPADAWTVSAHLFGDLEGIHIVHGPGRPSPISITSATTASSRSNTASIASVRSQPGSRTKSVERQLMAARARAAYSSVTCSSA